MIKFARLFAFNQNTSILTPQSGKGGTAESAHPIIWALLVGLIIAMAGPAGAQGKPQAAIPPAAGPKAERLAPAPAQPETLSVGGGFMEPDGGLEGPGPWNGGGRRRGGPGMQGPMGGGGFGGGMNGGGMGGGGFMGHFPPPLRRWQDFEIRLHECQNKFKTIEERRNKLLEQLTSEKRRYQPDKYDPASVLAHQTIDRLLGELHQAVEEGRTNTTDAVELVTTALMTRPVWEPSLQNDAAPPERGPAAGAAVKPERKQAWLEGLKRIDKEGTEGFARALLSEAFATEVVQSIPERLRWPAPFGMRRGGGAPMRRMMMDNVRQNLLARVERMEKQQEELMKEYNSQERELRQMRMILENAMFEPAPKAPALIGNNDELKTDPGATTESTRLYKSMHRK